MRSCIVIISPATENNAIRFTRHNCCIFILINRLIIIYFISLLFFYCLLFIVYFLMVPITAATGCRAGTNGAITGMILPATLMMPPRRSFFSSGVSSEKSIVFVYLLVLLFYNIYNIIFLNSYLT
jgi:hypothetical protein